MFFLKNLSFGFKNKAFGQFLCASTVSQVGSNIFEVAVLIYVAQKTRSVFALSGVTLALHLPFFLMAPLTGYLVDNFNKRKMLIFSDLAQIFFLGILAFHEFFFPNALLPLFLSIFCAKTFMILFETIATFQLIPCLVSKQELPKANAWFLSSQRFIQIAGPLLAGIIMTFGGFHLSILVNCLSFGATFYFVLKLKDLDKLVGDDKLNHHWRDITLGDIASNFAESFKFIWASPVFKPFVWMMFLWNLSSINPNHPTISHYFSVLQGFNPKEFGTVVSLFGVLGIIGFVFSGAFFRRWGFSRSFLGGCLWLAAIPSLSLFLFNHPWQFAIALAVGKMGSSLLSMGTFYIRQTHIPRSRMGGVNACLRMIFMASTPLTCLVQPVLVEKIGSWSSFLFGVLCLWGTVFFARKVAKNYSLSANSEVAGEDRSVAA